MDPRLYASSYHQYRTGPPSNILSPPTGPSLHPPPPSVDLSAFYVDSTSSTCHQVHQLQRAPDQLGRHHHSLLQDELCSSLSSALEQSRDVVNSSRLLVDAAGLPSASSASFWDHRRGSAVTPSFVRHDDVTSLVGGYMPCAASTASGSGGPLTDARQCIGRGGSGAETVGKHGTAGGGGSTSVTSSITSSNPVGSSNSSSRKKKSALGIK